MKLKQTSIVVAAFMEIVLARGSSASEISSEQCWIVQTALRNTIETIEKWREGDKAHLKPSVEIIIDGGLRSLTEAEEAKAEVYRKWGEAFTLARFHYREDLAEQAEKVLNTVCATSP